ncbi:MAG: glyoxalase [bacterium]|nr:glyoxalase [bacterium]
MPILALDHVQLAIPAGGEPEARAFLVDLLGMEEVPRPEPLAGRGGGWFRAGAVSLHLGVDPDFRPARKAHPALVVSDLAALCARLEQAGHAVRQGEDLPGIVRAFTHDPFGNRIELMQRA